jgi:peroxiredoxin
MEARMISRVSVEKGVRRGVTWFPWCGASMLGAVVLVVVVGLGVLAGPVHADTPGELDPLLRALSVRPWWGDPPPLAPLGLDGQQRSLRALGGRVVLLYFWATWCPICTRELPSEIESLHREFGGRGLVIWAISFREPLERVADWLKQHPVSTEVLVDPESSAAEAYRATGTPTFVLIDRAGQLVGRGVGPRDWTGDRGRALMRALLSER